MSDLRAAMYGPSDAPETLEEKPLTGKMAMQPGATIQAAHKNYVKVEQGNVHVVLPSAQYVDALKAQNDLMQREIARLANDLRKLQVNHNALVKEAIALRNELKNKVSKRGD